MKELNEMKSALRRWTGGHPHAVLYDEQTSSLLDVASGKSIKFFWGELAAAEERTHPETGDGYLVLLFNGGSQIALVDPGGIGFAPSTANSGEVQGLPAVVCLKDFHTLKSRVDHFLYQHPEAPPPADSLYMIMICIAILDGARAVGFDVGELEQELDKSLEKIEERRRK